MHACILSCFSCVQLSVTPWTIARQAPLSMGFSRQEYWSGLPCPFPRDLPDPGTEPESLMSPALAGEFFITSTTWEPFVKCTYWEIENIQTKLADSSGTSIRRCKTFFFKIDL